MLGFKGKGSSEGLIEPIPLATARGRRKPENTRSLSLQPVCLTEKPGEGQILTSQRRAGALGG